MLLIITMEEVAVTEAVIVHVIMVQISVSHCLQMMIALHHHPLDILAHLIEAGVLEVFELLIGLV
jgi:hypothetical protein